MGSVQQPVFDSSVRILKNEIKDLFRGHRVELSKQATSMDHSSCDVQPKQGLASLALSSYENEIALGDDAGDYRNDRLKSQGMIPGAQKE